MAHYRATQAHLDWGHTAVTTRCCRSSSSSIACQARDAASHRTHFDPATAAPTAVHTAGAYGTHTPLFGHHPQGHTQCSCNCKQLPRSASNTHNQMRPFATRHRPLPCKTGLLCRQTWQKRVPESDATAQSSLAAAVIVHVAPVGA
jgi:hypothetical protein